MTAQDYLRRYKRAEARLRRLEAEYRREMEMIDAIRVSSDVDGMPHGNGITKPTEDKAIRLADKALSWKMAALDAIQIRQEVFETIMKLDGLECDVLLERFVYLRKWEDVCESVGYTWPTVRNAWHRGEERIEKLIQEVT